MRCCWAVLAAAGLLLAGCGHEFPTAPARGVVRLAEQPAAGGRVVLLPAGGGKHASGSIGQDGSFVLSAYGNGDGAQVGENHVMILDAFPAGKEEKKASYRGGPAQRVRIEADRENELTLRVDPAQGWMEITD